MKFNDGAEVYAADGSRLGDVDRVILNPQTWEVIAIVVHKGFLFTTDKVVPIEDVEQTLENRVTLHASAHQNHYADFIETEYIPVVPENGGVTEQPSPMLYYPPFGAMLYNPMPVANPVVVHKVRNIPVNTEGLVIGVKVFTSDDQDAGHVKEVFMESTTNRASHILVSKGLLLPAEKLVPVEWIETIDEGEVRLVIGEKMLLSLPDYNRKE